MEDIYKGSIYQDAVYIRWKKVNIWSETVVSGDYTSETPSGFCVNIG